MDSKLIEKGSLEGIFADYAFCKMDGNGFLPIPLPTGSGKSTAIFNFIYAALKGVNVKCCGLRFESA